MLQFFRRLFGTSQKDMEDLLSRRGAKRIVTVKLRNTLTDEITEFQQELDYDTQKKQVDPSTGFAYALTYMNQGFQELWLVKRGFWENYDRASKEISAIQNDSNIDDLTKKQRIQDVMYKYNSG